MGRAISAAVVCVGVGASLALASSGSHGAHGPRFDAQRAFADLRYQVSLGPRKAGSPANHRLGAWLRARMPGGTFEAVPGGLRNVVYELPGRLPAVVVGAHYDTDDIPGFVGANDGASGTATLLELLRDLRGARRPGGPQLRFVSFDGEEKPAWSSDFLRDGIRGSRAYVRAHTHEVGAMILLDFVGNKGLLLPREGNSDMRLWGALRAAAKRAGKAPFFRPGTGPAVLDDHTPFLDAGIPAIDLIDFSYRYYDQVTDTLDKVSPRSLSATGQTVLELLERWPRAPSAGRPATASASMRGG